MKTFEDYLEEKFIEENPENYVKGFQYEGYYENWVMNLDRAKLIELADKAIKKERREEQDRILSELYDRVEAGLLDKSRQKTLIELVSIIKNE